MNDELQELIRTPREDLDIELKRWMDPNDKNVQAKFAKELLALRNHGGGYLVIGFKDELPPVPDPDRPETLNAFDSDYFNNIVKRYAEPGFHCMSYAIAHPITGEKYPVVVVPGGAKSPVRCKADSPDGGKSIKLDTYYIRRPGPESSPPQTGSEWDALMQRCLLGRKDELLATFSAMLGSSANTFSDGLPISHPIKPFEALSNFQRVAVSHLEQLQAEKLSTGDPACFPHGRYILSAHIIGELKQVSQRELLALMSSLTTYTGWSPLYVFNREELAPYPIDNKIVECWLARAEARDSAHADYWRVSTDGLVTLVRGHQEDAPEVAEGVGGVPVGTGLELTLPVWRVAEYILRVAELGEKLAVGPFRIQFIVDWEGLEGRKLFSFGRRRLLNNNYTAHTPNFHIEVEVTPEEVKAALPSVCAKIVGPLLRKFSFFEPPSRFYEEEIQKLIKREH